MAVTIPVNDSIVQKNRLRKPFSSTNISSPTMHSNDNNDWLEVKSVIAKKKTKFIFYSERLIKLYQNGCFAYYGAKSKVLKTMIEPDDLALVALEGRDKIKIMTKDRLSYLFKFNSCCEANEWFDALKVLPKACSETDSQ